MARGTIVKRGRNYTIVYRFAGRQRWETVGPKKKEAERILEERLRGLREGFRPGSIRPKLCRELFQEFMEDYAKTRVKPATLENWESYLRKYLLPVFASSPSHTVTPQAINGLLGRIIKAGRSPRTANNVLQLVRLIFRFAQRHGYCREDPSRLVDRLRYEEQEMRILAPDEIGVLLAASPEPYRTIYQVAVLTGMRQGEILGLRWDDINWETKKINVRYSLYMLRKQDLKEGETQRWRLLPVKSRKGRRAVDMEPALVNALEEFRARAAKSPYRFVFCDSLGEPLYADSTVRRLFGRHLEAAGCPQVRFHDLRHTNASLRIAAGQHPKYIQVQLGHASFKTTMDIYGHLFEEYSPGYGPPVSPLVFANTVLTKQAKKGSENEKDRERSDPKSPTETRS